MSLPVAYQNQFESVYVRGYWLPNILSHPGSPHSGLSGTFCHLEELEKNIEQTNYFFDMKCSLRSRTARYADFRDDTLNQTELKTLSTITSPTMQNQKAWSFILTRMVLGEILQQDPKTIEIDRVGKPRLINTQSVILGKSEARDRGPIYSNTTGSSHLKSKHHNSDLMNGSSIQGSFVSPVEDDGSSSNTPSSTLHFNISHSDNLWIIAWSFETEVGIDIQKIDESIKYQAIMRQFFTESERTKVHTVYDFFDLWTQKEAVLKLQGLSFAHMPKISTNSAKLFPLDIAPTFRGHIACMANLFC